MISHEKISSGHSWNHVHTTNTELPQQIVFIYLHTYVAITVKLKKAISLDGSRKKSWEGVRGEYDVILFQFLKLAKEGGEGGRGKGERGGGRGRGGEGRGGGK